MRVDPRLQQGEEAAAVRAARHELVDLNDPRLAAAVVAAVEARLQSWQREQLAVEEWGVVDEVDGTAFACSVFLKGSTRASPGYSYPAAEVPVQGDLVRVRRTPDGGDKSVVAIFGRAATAAAGGGGTGMQVDYPTSPAGVGDYLARVKLAADTKYRLQAGLTPTDAAAILFGPGGTTDPDLRLYRSAAKALLLDDGAGGAITALRVMTAAGAMAVLNAGLLTTRGDLIRQGALGIERVALGAAHQVLTSDGTDAAWADNGVDVTLAGITTATAVSQANITIRLFEDAGSSVFLTPASGTARMLAIRFSATRTAGTATVTLRNDTLGTVLLTCTINTTGVQDANDGRYGIGAAGHTFAANTQLSLRITTDASWAPTTAKLLAVAVLTLD